MAPMTPVEQRQFFQLTLVRDLDEGFYWVRFEWGWEPCEWTGFSWFRTGLEGDWNQDVLEVGNRLVHA